MAVCGIAGDDLCGNMLECSDSFEWQCVELPVIVCVATSRIASGRVCGNK